jgi:hypothetical protein
MIYVFKQKAVLKPPKKDEKELEKCPHKVC